jgi:hypothetical protein
MVLNPTTVTPSNEKLYVTGAVSTFIYACTGTDSYILTVPIAHEVLGIFANFGSDANVDEANWIVCDNSDKTVKVLTTGGGLDGAAIEVNAMVVAKKVGGIS